MPRSYGAAGGDGVRLRQRNSSIKPRTRGRRTGVGKREFVCDREQGQAVFPIKEIGRSLQVIAKIGLHGKVGLEHAIRLNLRLAKQRGWRSAERDEIETLDDNFDFIVVARRVALKQPEI